MNGNNAAPTAADLDLDWMEAVCSAMIDFMEADPCPSEAQVRVVGGYLDWCVDSGLIGDA